MGAVSFASHLQALTQPWAMASSSAPRPQPPLLPPELQPMGGGFGPVRDGGQWGVGGGQGASRWGGSEGPRVVMGHLGGIMGDLGGGGSMVGYWGSGGAVVMGWGVRGGALRSIMGDLGAGGGSFWGSVGRVSIRLWGFGDPLLKIGRAHV